MSAPPAPAQAVLRSHAIALLAAIAVAGCSSVTAYRNDLPKNLRVDARVSSGSALTTINAGFHVYGVNRRCELAYLGTVELAEGQTDVGLPADRTVYLEFYFAKSAVLANASSSITHGTLFTAHAGTRYAAQVRYLDDLYKVRLREQIRGGAQGRALERVPLESCVPK